jgi:hypothetical protein
MHQYLNKPSFVNVGALTPFFYLLFRLHFLKKLLIFTKSCKSEIYLCKKSSNQEMFAISLSSRNRYNANFKFDQSVFAIHDSPSYFWDQRGRLPTHVIFDELQTSLMYVYVWNDFKMFISRHNVLSSRSWHVM